MVNGVEGVLAPTATRRRYLVPYHTIPRVPSHNHVACNCRRWTHTGSGRSRLCAIPDTPVVGLCIYKAGACGRVQGSAADGAGQLQGGLPCLRTGLVCWSPTPSSTMAWHPRTPPSQVTREDPASCNACFLVETLGIAPLMLFTELRSARTPRKSGTHRNRRPHLLSFPFSPSRSSLRGPPPNSPSPVFFVQPSEQSSSLATRRSIPVPGLGPSS